MWFGVWLNSVVFGLQIGHQLHSNISCYEFQLPEKGVLSRKVQMTTPLSPLSIPIKNRKALDNGKVQFEEEGRKKTLTMQHKNKTFAPLFEMTLYRFI